MRTLKYLFLGLVLLVIVVLSLANAEPVTLKLLPEGMARLMPASIRLPLFVVLLVSVVFGMALGYFFEYAREHKHRRRAAEKHRETVQLGRQVDQLRKQTGRPEDDVLALLGN